MQQKHETSVQTGVLLPKEFFFLALSQTVYNTWSLRPEGAENMSLGSQVSDICFGMQNWIRNPKMGSKQSIAVPP